MLSRVQLEVLLSVQNTLEAFSSPQTPFIGLVVRSCKESIFRIVKIITPAISLCDLHSENLLNVFRMNGDSDFSINSKKCITGRKLKMIQLLRCTKICNDRKALCQNNRVYIQCKYRYQRLFCFALAVRFRKQPVHLRLRI